MAAEMPRLSAVNLALFGGEPAVQIPAPHFRWPLIGTEEEEAVLNQLRSGPLSMPRRCGVIEEFEANFAAFHGLPYSLSTGSGTAALHSAYFGLGLEPGDEVLVPAYTHLGTVLPMLLLGLIPVLCDVEEETGNLDLKRSRIAARQGPGRLRLHMNTGTSATWKRSQQRLNATTSTSSRTARTHTARLIAVNRRALSGTLLASVCKPTKLCQLVRAAS